MRELWFWSNTILGGGMFVMDGAFATDVSVKVRLIVTSASSN
jgi:hypothetical protein